MGRFGVVWVVPLVGMFAPCSASPFWCIDYLYHDIRHAKEKGNRILEVRILKREFLKRATRVERIYNDYDCQGHCPDSAEVTRDIFKLEMEVQANILNYIHPGQVRLIVLDDRHGSTLRWTKFDSAWKEPLIVVVDKRGRLEALYPEKSPMSGDEKLLRLRREEIAGEIAIMRNDPEYLGFVDWSNTHRILKAAKVLPR